ncbi:M24 family metallopeptidase [Actinomadura opuntiae]|uniref:M24 family metallopeptidase n=1 Tax=Actinomadura sp. OS1-43 TaxID=604315 RepID=UPI00255A9C94|nr:M24 family metallopeptidase [Actinomadura sp. OS1-43]MDL4817329.1 M24 family metallopeptidase [Actinomadura sp. OS1-43]
MSIPTYSLAERDRRWTLARNLMDAQGLDALIAYGEHECADLAPFAPDAYFSNDRPGSFVIFCRDADPVQLVWSNMSIQDNIEARKRGDELWIEPRNIRAGSVIQPGKNAAGIVEVLREHKLEHSAVGVLGLDIYPPFHLNPVIPYLLWREVLSELPDVTFKPVGAEFMLATICLSDEELAVLRYSAAAGDAMAEAMLETAGTGVSEAELYAAGMAAGFRLGCAAPDMLLWSGPGFIAWGPPAWSYRPQEPRRLDDGDVVLAEVFCRFGMKETQHQVAIAVGDPHPDIEAAAAIARSAYEAGLKVARPGNTFGELAEAMMAPLQAAGSWNIHPLVHTLNPYGPVCGFGPGLRQVPEAREYGRLFDLPTIGGELPLTPGMSFSFEPNAVVGGKAVNLGGTVVIGEDDPIELNPLTAHLLHT